MTYGTDGGPTKSQVTGSAQGNSIINSLCRLPRKSRTAHTLRWSRSTAQGRGCGDLAPPSPSPTVQADLFGDGEKEPCRSQCRRAEGTLRASSPTWRRNPAGLFADGQKEPCRSQCQRAEGTLSVSAATGEGEAPRPPTHERSRHEGGGKRREGVRAPRHRDDLACSSIPQRLPHDLIDAQPDPPRP